MSGVVRSGDTRVTERDMLDLLLRRYTDVRRGTIADRWVRAEHVGLTLGGPRKRVADFIAADRYPGVPYGSALALHGHEVKVSRSDWLSERRDLEKAESFKRFVHRWWLVVPDRSIVRDGELPEGWGLLVKSGDVLRAVIKAPALTPEPLPLDLSISLMSAAARTAYRDPLRRDAPRAYIRTWEPRCGFCGELSPCAAHQPRQCAPESIDRTA